MSLCFTHNALCAVTELICEVRTLRVYDENTKPHDVTSKTQLQDREERRRTHLQAWNIAGEEDKKTRKERNDGEVLEKSKAK